MYLRSHLTVSAWLASVLATGDAGHPPGPWGHVILCGLPYMPGSSAGSESWEDCGSEGPLCASLAFTGN